MNITHPDILKVVFHVSNLDQIGRMVNNINNLLIEDPKAEIILVANGESVKAFTKDALTKLNPKATYYLCENSLSSNQIDHLAIMEGTKIIPSSVHTLAQLQYSGYAYIKV